jgi:ABC-2 type transport system ATP-binding protein
MIEVKHLTKTYGSVQAVRDVSFEVGAKEVVGFLGPNGAGKSTTLRIIAGFLGATRGRVVVDGVDTVQEPVRARSRIGYMPENVPLYPEMRVNEYLRFRAELKGVPRAQRKEAVERAMRDVHLYDHAQVIIGNLSKGYRQRVGLADALVSRPAVLVLDEPTAGLDPNQIRDVRDLIRSLAKHHAVLLSTHIMSEVEATCDRALVIDRGRLVAQGTLDDLRKLRRSRATRFAVRGEPARALEVLEKIEGVRDVREASSRQDVVVIEVRWTQKGDTAASTEQAVQALVDAGMKLREVAPTKASLEDVFALLTEEEQLDESDASTDSDTSDRGEASP